MAEREKFLDRVKSEGFTRLLEIGAGTGQDSVFFRDNGLSVVATDLSAEMVAHCHQKGIEAYQMDFMSLGFDEPFHAVHAMNCLLHVPDSDLDDVLRRIRDVLVPGGLAFIGVYGGPQHREGPFDDDQHVPPRYFVFRTDAEIREAVSGHFELVDFRVVAPGDFHFQSLTLRKPVLA